MKIQKMFFALVFICCFLFSGISFAQSDESSVVLRPVGVGLHAEQYKIGEVIGADYSVVAYTSTVLVPINCSQHFRIEPEFGMLWMHNKEEEESNLGVSIGVGMFGMFQREKINLYAGGRFMFSKAEMGGFYYYNGDQLDVKTTIIRVGPAFGFEYFLCKNFSVGGEAGFRYVFSKMKVAIPVYDDVESTTHMINFDSGLFVRVYF